MTCTVSCALGTYQEPYVGMQCAHRNACAQLVTNLQQVLDVPKTYYQHVVSDSLEAT